MKLYQYLAFERESGAAFAVRAGLPQATIHKYIHGAGASLRNALKVYKATDGAVELEDLLPSMDPPEYYELFRRLAERDLQAVSRLYQAARDAGMPPGPSDEKMKALHEKVRELERGNEA